MLSGVGDPSAPADSDAAGQTSPHEKHVQGGNKLDKLRVLLGHPNGNPNVRNILSSLVEHGMLAEFWTSIAWDSQSHWNRLLPGSVRAEFARRSFPEAPRCQVRTTPWRELVRLGARSTPLAGMLCTGEQPFSSIGTALYFDDCVARRLAQLQPTAVYAYEGVAYRTFREAARLGVTTLYELPSGHWYWERNLLTEEAQRNPDYADLLPKLNDSADYMRGKDEELRLADYVFVPSEHVRQSLQGVVAEEKIRVISYGAPPVRPRKHVARNAGEPLKVLFAGSLVQRKGIGYLLEAVEMMGSQVELTMLGRRFRPNVKVDAACRRWNWIETLPNARVLDVMLQSDVLVLPSLSEGCALVVLEALACGLPVIVTPNTGSLGFVHDGQEGFVVPICRADAIAERLETLYGDRDLLAEMSRRAQRTAAENSWENFRANWARIVGSLACF